MLEWHLIKMFYDDVVNAKNEIVQTEQAVLERVLVAE